MRQNIKNIIKKTSDFQPLYIPRQDPMRIIVFASGGGGNLQAAIDLSLREPALLKVELIVTDRLGIKAIDIAQQYNIPVIADDFEKACGKWSECENNPKKIQAYQKAAIKWHNDILAKIIDLEKGQQKPFDFVVLSYHRWIHGDLLFYFNKRIINQHAGDLTIMAEHNSLERKYRGINPVLMALLDGEKKTRTSTFLVREGHDTGEILCQGPWITYTGSLPITKDTAWEHEVKQKQQSDWPSLMFALKHIAQGEYGVIGNEFHPDGGNVITFKNKPLPYGGVDIEKDLI